MVTTQGTRTALSPTDGSDLPLSSALQNGEAAGAPR